MSKLRYVVPNAITATSIAFGVLSILASVRGRPREAAWWVLYCVLSDKLDGFAARALKASSAFGMQLDSLADLVAFGIAPATLFYAFFSAHPEAGWSEGWRPWALLAIAIGYAICAALRLARFNVIADSPGAERVYFGIPSTLAGGALAALVAALLKYGDPAWSPGGPYPDWRLLGAARLDGLVGYLPWAMAAGGVAMVSRLRVPKIGRTPWIAGDVLLIGNVIACYAVGLFRRLPEYLAASALAYIVLSVGFHLLSPSARAARPPELFKRASG